MVDIKALFWLAVIFGFAAFIFYILSGNTKERLWKIGFVFAMTYVLFRYVSDPLDRVCKDYFLGELHKHETYKGHRYRVYDVVDSSIDTTSGHMEIKAGTPIAELFDSLQIEPLISKSDSCISISLNEHDETLIAECHYYDSKPYAYFIVKDGSLTRIDKQKFYKYSSTWRGNIISKDYLDTSGRYVENYVRTDGKSLTLIQKFLVKRDLKAYTYLVLSIIISLIFTHWLTKPNKNEETDISND